MNRLTQPIEGIEDMTDDQIFGATIKQLRENRGLTVKNIAFDTGISKSTIEHMEKGKGCTMANANKVARALGAELYELL